MTMICQNVTNKNDTVEENSRGNSYLTLQKLCKRKTRLVNLFFKEILFFNINIYCHTGIKYNPRRPL